MTSLKAIHQTSHSSLWSYKRLYTTYFFTYAVELPKPLKWTLMCKIAEVLLYTLTVKQNLLLNIMKDLDINRFWIYTNIPTPCKQLSGNIVSFGNEGKTHSQCSQCLWHQRWTLFDFLFFLMVKSFHLVSNSWNDTPITFTLVYSSMIKQPSFILKKSLNINNKTHT